MSDSNCLIEKIMASNGSDRWEEGFAAETAQVLDSRNLKSKFDEAEHPLGSAALTELTCEACGRRFLFEETMPGQRAAVYFQRNGNSKTKSGGAGCDPREALPGKRPLLNVNLVRMNERAEVVA
jgi:hypothetical protein